MRNIFLISILMAAGSWLFAWETDLEADLQDKYDWHNWWTHADGKRVGIEINPTQQWSIISIPNRTNEYFTFAYELGNPSLPDEVIQNPKIKRIVISGHSFERLPADVCKMTNLEELVIENGPLQYLPPEFANLQKLKFLSLIDNRLTEIPDVICSLKNLRLLALCENSITNIPPNIKGLTNLQCLYVDNCVSLSIPSELYDLGQLEVLSMNGYLDKPVLLPVGISKLHSLRMLSLEGDYIFFDRKGRQLPRGGFPEEISSMKNLQEIRLARHLTAKERERFDAIMPWCKVYELREIKPPWFGLPQWTPSNSPIFSVWPNNSSIVK